ncbi:MAG: glutathione S-transferase N-terminal domain-containing protein [Myxococcales bacterium]|nr:glutathione S-transferase N-terminal domain-containing protein [Myxococcales bacterium]
MLELLGISYSPWTHKAKWALQHHQLPFTYREYAPGIGAIGLRWRLRRRTGVVSVPVLFVDGAAVEDSWAIAQWAEQHGSGAPLFLDATATKAWHERCDLALQYGRGHVIEKLLRSDAALDEASRGAMPAALARYARPIARAIAKQTQAKYQPAPGRDALIGALAAAEQAVSSTTSFLLGEFSFADIAVATMLEAVEPVSDTYAKRGPASRAVWRDDELALKHARLLAWRDWVCEQRRQPRKAAAI